MSLQVCHVLSVAEHRRLVPTENRKAVKLKHALCLRRSDKDLGWDSDDEDLKKGLQKQDSLEFTRARLAKQREERKIEALRKIASRSDVDFVVDENAKVVPVHLPLAFVILEFYAEVSWMQCWQPKQGSLAGKHSTFAYGGC